MTGAFLTMRWLDLLFAHWPVRRNVLRPMIPSALELDTFDGSAWLGIVPFRMTHVRPLGLPLPGEAFAFAETNVRTYVTAPDGTRGIWFFSLDGAHLRARRRHAWASACPTTTRGSARRPMAPGSSMRADAPRRHRPSCGSGTRPAGAVRHAAPGSLEAFLTDRMALFARHRGRLTATDVEHAPWPLQGAEAEIERNTMTAPFGIALPPVPPIVQFARRLDTVAHRPRPIGR